MVSDRGFQKDNRSKVIYYDQYGKHQVPRGGNIPQNSVNQHQNEQVRVFSVDDHGRLIQ